MKLVVQIKLLPDADQSAALLAYMRAFNSAATHAAKVGFEAGVYSQPSIHGRCYRELRDTFGVSSQTAVRAIGKAVECFARDKTVCPRFRPDGAVTYDQRNMGFKGVDKVSLSTLTGREVIGMVYGEYQRERFDRIKGQCDLVYQGGKFYLLATADLPEAPPGDVKDFIGVDLGIVQIVTTDDGTTFSGAKIDNIRKRCARARTTYQRRNTRSARRRLRKMNGRQQWFQKDTNHILSKQLVAKALHEGKGIGLEDLTGIRTRTEATVRHTQRSRHSNWSFAQLRLFVEYKARLAGVPVIPIDPRNTSRTCSVCGYCDKGNRKSQNHFVCLRCGHAANADQNGACNIRLRALAAYVNSRDSVATSGEHPDSATSRGASSPSGS
jgi:putative transposase